MKRLEAIAGSPALIALFLVVAGVAGVETKSELSAHAGTAVVVAEWPAPGGDVPFIDGMTVTANRG